jgi:hypothetical protein
MTERPFGYSPESEYKPEADRDLFTVVDWLLSVHQFMVRVDAAKDLTSAHVQLGYARDALGFLAAELAKQDPSLGPEVLAAIKAQPQLEFDSIDYLVREQLNDSAEEVDRSPEPPERS